MTKSAINIVLAGKSYPIRPTTIDQLGRIEAILMSGDRTRPVSMAVKVLDVALSRDHHDVAVAGLEGTFAEIDVASKAVLKLAGFMADDPAPSDDAPAGAALAIVDTGAQVAAAE